MYLLFIEFYIISQIILALLEDRRTRDVTYIIFVVYVAVCLFNIDVKMIG